MRNRDKMQEELNSGNKVEDAAEEDPKSGEGTAEVASDAADSVTDEAPQDPSGEDEQEEPSDGLTQEKFDELDDLYKRALADAQNTRRIAERDKLEASRFGASRMARDLLPVHDSLQRALDSVDDQQRENASALIHGIELTLKELLNAVGRHGVKIVSPARGDPFDPKLHQAMFEAPSPDIASGAILEVMADGFTMHDRLLRPAQVGVSSGSPVQDVQVEQQGAASPVQ